MDKLLWVIIIGSFILQLDDIFSDPDEDPLTYMISSSNEAVATFQLEGSS